MNKLKYEVLLIGIGNVLMGDDGLGVYAAEELKKREWPPEVCILEAGLSVMYYLEEISCARSVIAVDAVRAGGRPGNIYRFMGREIKNSPEKWRNSHGFSLLEVVELSKHLTGLPANLIIYGVEPLELGFRNELSPAVNETMPFVIKRIIKEIDKILTFPVECENE